MALAFIAMSKFILPSKEGGASALFMIEQLIHLLTVKEREFEAFKAPKNIIISPRNVHKIDIDKISDFGPKSMEILRKLQASKCKQNMEISDCVQRFLSKTN